MITHECPIASKALLKLVSAPATEDFDEAQSLSSFVRLAKSSPHHDPRVNFVLSQRILLDFTPIFRRIVNNQRRLARSPVARQHEGFPGGMPACFSVERLT